MTDVRHFFACLMGITGVLLAQQPTVPPTVPPTVSGGRPGTEVTLPFTATQPLALWSLPALSARLITDGGTVNTTFTIAARAPAGPLLLRLATAGGWDGPRVFSIDPWPEVATAADNRARPTAQLIARPAVITGHIEPEASRYFRFTVARRERVAIDALARRLGSALDPVLIVHDLTNNREVKSGVVDDTPGLWGDCRLALTLDPGDYVIELRDSTYRGGPEYRFRLRVGDVPLPTAAMPMAVRRGQRALVTFFGDGCTESAVTVSAPAEPGLASVFAAPTPDAWPLPILISDHDELFEREPNDGPANAIDLPIPCGITGQFLTRTDRDWYRLTLKKDTKIRLQAWSAEVGSPADVLLTIRAADGKDLTATDPSQLTPRLDFTAPADGTYFAIAEHVNYLAGPEQVYRLTVRPQAGFELTLPQLTADVAPGTTTDIKLKLTRGGYDGPIELTAHGADGLEGKLTIAAGKAGDVVLPLKARADMPVGVATVRVVGHARINDKDVLATAHGRDVLKGTLAGWPDPPADWCAAIAVAVKPKLPDAAAKPKAKTKDKE